MIEGEYIKASEIIQAIENNVEPLLSISTKSYSNNTDNVRMDGGMGLGETTSFGSTKMTDIS